MKKRVLACTLAGVLTVSLVAGNGAIVSAKKKAGINKKKVTISVGKTVKLKVKGVGAKKVRWSSSKGSVAAVNKKGVVKGKKAGKATITAKVGKKKYKCKVTVKAAGSSRNTASSKVDWEKVSNKFDKLTDYIMSNGTEADEMMVLQKEESDESGKTTLQIGYDGEQEALILDETVVYENGEGYSLMLTITKEDPETAAVECQITQSDVTYIGTSEIEVASFKEEEESLGFDYDAGTSSEAETAAETDASGSEDTGLDDDLVEELDGQATDYLYTSLTDWEDYLGEAGVGVSLKELGFVSYEF